MESKRCTKCNRMLPITNFNKRNNRPCGYISQCKDCQKKYKQSRQSSITLNENDLKKCIKCKEYKFAKEFNKNKGQADGLCNICVECDRKKGKKYREDNKEKISSKGKERYQDPEYKLYEKTRHQKYYLNNKDGYLERSYERKRELGFEPLNENFEGSNFHHLIYFPDGSIDNNIGIYIPYVLHRSFWHSRKKPESFDLINRLALDFFINGQRNLRCN